MRLGERKKAILTALIERHIQTGEPVGSKYLADCLGCVSSATIRNDMSDLERAGLLEQPHASAGRTPTHLGYRYYIDSLMRPKPLSGGERMEIDALFNVRNPDPDRLLEDAARALSHITGLATVSTTITPATVTVRRVDLIPAGKRTMVIMVIASSGVIKNKVCRVDFEITDEIVDFFRKFTNSRLAGRTLDEISSAYISSVAISMGEYSTVFNSLLAAIYELIREINEGQYYLVGSTNLLEYSELAPISYELLVFIEDRHKMQKALEPGESGTRITVGRENQNAQLMESSLLASAYYVGGVPAGTIGIIGPVRMDYARLIPRLDYFARTLGELLSDTLDNG